ncbi:MAG: molybdenum cofactor biosynthesis protein MoaE [Pseudomonadota bacterium]
MTDISIVSGPFDPAREVDAVRRDNPKVGGVVSFTGYMRDINENRAVKRMFLEHYPGMTEKALQQIVDEARQRWDLEGIRVVHRVGAMDPLDPIVVVAVASRHRGDAFRACEFIIDFLKTRAPFWKKEETDQGGHWVDARDSDDTAAHRWDAEKSR